MARLIRGSDGSVIIEYDNFIRKDGMIYTENGGTTFGSDGSSSFSSGNMTWQNNWSGTRTVTKSGNTWYASDGKTYRYQSGAGILYCSDGRSWTGLSSESDADRVVRTDC